MATGNFQQAACIIAFFRQNLRYNPYISHNSTTEKFQPVLFSVQIKCVFAFALYDIPANLPYLITELLVCLVPRVHSFPDLKNHQCQ